MPARVVVINDGLNWLLEAVTPFVVKDTKSQYFRILWQL